MTSIRLNLKEKKPSKQKEILPRMGSFTFYFESGVKLDLKVKRGGTYCAFSDIPRPVLEDIQVALTRAMEGKGDK